MDNMVQQPDVDLDQLDGDENPKTIYFRNEIISLAQKFYGRIDGLVVVGELDYAEGAELQEVDYSTYRQLIYRYKKQFRLFLLKEGYDI